MSNDQYLLVRTLKIVGDADFKNLFAGFERFEVLEKGQAVIWFICFDTHQDLSVIEKNELTVASKAILECMRKIQIHQKPFLKFLTVQGVRKRKQ